jgi:DNA-binding CsgD family transcriptional regulator
MGNFQALNSLSEKDSLAIQEVINHLLLKCKTRPSLKALFESRILPLLKADSALYAWTDPDLLSPKLIDSINIPEEELVLIDQFVTKDPEAGSLLTHSHPVIARDIDIPKDNEAIKDPFKDEPLREDPFSKRESAVNDGYSYFGTSKTGVITLALRDPNLGAGIHRNLPCDKPWSVRDVNVLEHIRTPLLMAIKTIVLAEELAKHKSMLNILADSPTAIAVVDSEMRVSYSNPAWNELMNGASRQLDPELKSILQKEKLKCDPHFANSTATGMDPTYKLSDRECQLGFTPLLGDHLEDQDSWLLQVKPVTGLNSGSYGYLREAGLTKREVEACELLRQGIDPHLIAERLFISPHTVKTHLKRIHQKLGVHTRAQLVAALNR